jgi:hypothetical protein
LLLLNDSNNVSRIDSGIPAPLSAMVMMAAEGRVAMHPTEA